MGNIIILDENTSNKIAAGEVIERPASVVKELVENSIDAGASAITVEIKDGGISYIKVTDNGTGIEEDDVEIAFERHATSKIRNSSDLESISTMGFRGEALASIAAVSNVELTTRVEKKPSGTYIRLRGGVVEDVKQIGCPVGTTFIVRDLFFNTPARFKFLKKDTAEAGYVSDIVSRIALGNPHISIRLVSNGSTVLHTPGNNDLLSAIFSIYGKEAARFVVPINYSDSRIKVEGYAGRSEIARSNRNQQSIFINRRFIKSRLISSAIDEAYKTILMKNKYPFIVLKLEVNPSLVDVNVHPAKLEVRFSDEQEIFRGVYHAVNNALLRKQSKPDVQLPDQHEPSEDTFRFACGPRPNTSYAQQKINTFDVRIKEKEGFEYETKNGFGLNTFYKMENNNKSDICRNNDKGIQKEADKQSVEGVSEYKIIGQAFSTYIIVQREDELMLIDQHAAHERIMFEKLKKRYRNKENLSQELLIPLVIDLTYKEIKFLEEKKELFLSLGFNFESFGNTSVILRSVPLVRENDMVRNIFLGVLDRLISSSDSDIEALAEEALYTLACKSAVKANATLDDSEIDKLLQELEELENPYTCPHGRPTAIIITRHELEKRFKRIV